MLPSKGYFSELPCVFYLDGDCHRPHCHYRHSAKDLKTNVTKISGKSGECGKAYSVTPDQLSIFTKFVERAVDQVFQSDPEAAHKSDRNTLVRKTLDQVLADPETLKLVKHSKKTRPAATPSYQPTPISELNHTHIPVMFVPENPVLTSRETRNGSEHHSSQFRSLTDGIRPSLGKASLFEESSAVACQNLNLSTSSQSSVLQKLDSGEDHRRPSRPKWAPPQNLPSIPGIEKPSINTCERSNLMLTTEENCRASSNYNFVTGTYQDCVESSSQPKGLDEGNTNKSSTMSNSKNHSLPDAKINLVRSEYDCEKCEVKCQIPLSKFNAICNRDDKCLDSQRDGKRRKLLETCHGTPQPMKQFKRDSYNAVDFEHQASWPKLPKLEPPPRKVFENRGKNATKNSRAIGRSHPEAGNDEMESTVMETPSSEISATIKGAGIKKCIADPVVSSKPKINHERPPEKRRKMEVLKMQVSSTGLDPFARWQQNKKVRQILGKPDPKKSFLPPIRPKSPLSVDSLMPAKEARAQSPNEELPVPKVTKRVAHNKDNLRPTPILGENIVVPIGFRQYFCDAFFEEFKKKMSPEKARSRAARKEFEIAKNSKLTRTYKNNCTLLLVKYRKGVYETSEGNAAKSTDLNLSPSSRPDFTYGWSLHRCFSKYLLSEDQLRENGFPLVLHDQPECAYVDKASRRYSNEQPSDKPHCRICANCSKEFRIDPTGKPQTKNDCFYHWGKLRKVRFSGQWQEVFTCCDGMVDSTPCESSKYHVWSGRNEDCLTGYVNTPKWPTHMDECDAGIYALDCEMCYTTNGLELARLTVLNVNDQVVFDQVVSLKSPVLNYCTRFSGIDAQKIADATYSFDDVRKWVLEHFFDKTILVGHSLENDLKALKLVHSTVVDTSVTFPHQFGPPHKLSLKHLASSILQIAIQENENGHDSKEDAATCLKLMMKKIKEDSKIRKPRVFIQYNGKKS